MASSSDTPRADYRHFNRNFRYSPADTNQSNDPKQNGDTSQNQTNGGETQSGGEKDKEGQRSQAETSNNPTKKKKLKPKPSDHNENWETLFPAVQVTQTDRKLKALVSEAQVLTLQHPYAGTMLFRVIIERALNNYIRSLNKFKDLKQHIFDEAEKAKRPIRDELKKMYAPQLANIVAWISTNPDIFPDDSARDLAEATRLLKGHLKEINKVVHEGGLTSSAKLRIVRDDCWHLIEYLLQHNPPSKDG